MERRKTYEKEESKDAYVLYRMSQLTEPELVVDNLGLFGMEVSSLFDSKLGFISHFSIISHLSIISHNILEEGAMSVSSWQVIWFSSSVNF